MKWLLLLAIIAAVPAFMGALRSNPKMILWAGVLIGFLPFGITPYHLYTAPISWPAWPGTVKGLEVSFLDSLALAIILTTPRVRIASPVLIAFALYFVAVLFSTAVAQQWVPASFYVWQLIRTALLCVAVTRATGRHAEFPMRVLWGLGIGLMIEAVHVANQFAQGAAQAGGQFGQNTLGLMSDFVVFPAIAMLLAGHRARLALIIFLCDLVVVLGGGSRATVGLFAIGTVVVTILSFWHRSTARKTAITIAAVVTMAVATPALMWSVNRRSDEARNSSNATREAFKKAARLIIADHPLGVGANQYLIVANVGGYSDRAGVAWNYSERSAPVHNSYYLAAAELGLLGFATLSGLLAAIILVGLRAIKHAGDGPRASLLVGAVAAVVVATAHIGFEWIAMLFSIHYLFAIGVGLIMGLRLDALRRPKGSSARRSVAPRTGVVQAA